MLDWIKEHAEYVIGTLGGAALGTIAWCIKFVHFVRRIGDRVADLERLFREHDEEVGPLRERFVTLESAVAAMKDDIAEGKVAHRELVVEVRKDREEARTERRELMRFLRTLNQNMQDGFSRIIKKD